MVLPLRIEGTGAALPATILLSADIDARLGKPSGWLLRRTGVNSRRVAAADDQVSLAVAASRAAMAEAGIGAGEIDLVIFAAAVPYQSIPATAPLLQRELGIGDGRAAAFDVNSTCLSFLTGLDLAATMLAAGRCTRVLVAAAEIASRALPWTDDPETAGLFGDGAAAAVVSAGPGDGAIMAARMETYPAAYEACQLGAGGTRYDYHAAPQDFAAHAYFAMQGDVLYRTTRKYFPGFVDRLLAAAGWTHDEVDVVVPHQASPGALAHLATKTGFRPERVINLARDLGNQVAASLPIMLDHARRTGRLARGQKALLLGTSAGISFGGMALVA